MPGLGRPLCTAVLAVNGRETGALHRSVLDRVAEVAVRLGCGGVASLARLPVTFDAASARRLRRELDQVIAFADAARLTGWTLGDLAVAPGERAVPVLDTPEGRLWADPLHGFELRAEHGVRRVTELPPLTGTARRTALTVLAGPFTEAVARGGELNVYERLP
jgi:hypothetical protein